MSLDIELTSPRYRCFSVNQRDRNQSDRSPEHIRTFQTPREGKMTQTYDKALTFARHQVPKYDDARVINLTLGRIAYEYLQAIREEYGPDTEKIMRYHITRLSNSGEKMTWRRCREAFQDMIHYQGKKKARRDAIADIGFNS